MTPWQTDENVTPKLGAQKALSNRSFFVDLKVSAYLK